MSKPMKHPKSATTSEGTCRICKTAHAKTGGICTKCWYKVLIAVVIICVIVAYPVVVMITGESSPINLAMNAWNQAVVTLGGAPSGT